MTKKELVKELHQHGELWANETFAKKYLEDYLNGLERARKMSFEELSKVIGLEG